MSNDPQTRRRLDLIVFLGLALYIGAVCYKAYTPHTFIFRDGSFYAQVNRSIAEGFTLRQEAVQPSSWYDGSLPWYRNIDDAWSNVSVGVNGEWYPKHSYLMPVFSTPLFILFGPPGLLLFNALALVLALFSGYLLAARYAGPTASAVAALMIGTSPLISFLAYSYSHDVFCAALLAGGCALLAGRRWALGGLLLGLSVYAKVTVILIALPMGLALIGLNRRALWLTALWASIPLAVYAMLNMLMYGHPLTTSYHRILTARDGIQHIVSYGTAFDTPLAQGYERFFSHSHEGELVESAIIPFYGYWGAVLLLRRTPGMALGLGVSFAAFILAYAQYRYGGARFFMPWLAVGVLPLAALLSFASGLVTSLSQRWGGWMNATMRRWSGALALVVVAVITVVLWIPGGRSEPGSLSDDVEGLSVVLDGRPCDYFNMAHSKWECSHLDPGGAYFVGIPLGRQCAFAKRPMVWAPPNPSRKTRTISWRPDVDGSGLRVTWGLDPRSRKGSLRFRVRVGDRPPVEFETSGHGHLSQRVFEDLPVEPGTPVEVTIDPAGRKGLFLCLDIDIL